MNGAIEVEVLKTGMGNEISQTEGVKQSVGGEGQVGHFHKVLVEPEYSSGNSQPELELPDGNFVVTRPGDGVADVKGEVEAVPPDPKIDIHEQDTLKIRGTTDDNSHENSEKLVDQSLDEEDALFEECKALISAAADRAVKRSLSKPAKPDLVTDLDAASTGEGIEQVDVVDQRKSSVTQSVDEVTVDTEPADVTCNNLTNTFGNKVDVNIKSNSLDIETSDISITDYADASINVDTPDVSVNVDDMDVKDNDIEIKAKGKDKKSKSKKRDIAEFEREVIESVKEELGVKSGTETKSTTLEKKSSKGNIFTNMFKFSKRKSKSNVDGDPDQNGKDLNGKADKKVDSTILETPTSDDFSKPSTSFEANNDVAAVKRLNSLDSGIVVEKVCEQQPVEYAVVQKKRDDKVGNGNDVTPVIAADDKDITVNPVVGQRLAEPVYINGDKNDEDFVYINERAVDIEGLVKPVDSKLTEALPVIVDQTDDDKLSEGKKPYDDEMESNISSDSGTGMGTKVKTIDKAKPDKAKLKKKSWSFQMGKKKQTPKTESTEDGAVVSMDPNASPKEAKKPKWRFGKFSFRRSQTDISASTPNLHQTGIPEENEAETPSAGKQEKKKSKLKLLKSKKDKKKEQQQLQQQQSQQQEEDQEAQDQNMERRSTSLIDLILGDNAPMSRKSIVEEDMNLSQTDAFEGVSLSDLSLDGDVAVSNNPSGSDEQQKNKKKKSSKKDSKKKAKLELKQSKEKPSEPLVMKPKTATSKADTVIPKAEINTTTEVGVAATAGEISTITELDNQQEDDPQVYMNQASIDKQLISDTADDEYVNIAQAVHDIAEANLKEAEQDDIVHETVNDTEYALIVKKKHVDDEAQKQPDEEPVKKSKIIAQAEIVDAAKIAKLTENAIKISENSVKNESTGKQDTEQNIIEPPGDFKDDENQAAAEELIVSTQQEKAFSNLIYSDEAFNAAMAGIKNAKSGEKEAQTEDPDTSKDEEEDVTVSEEKEPAADLEEDGDAYVQLQDIVSDVSKGDQSVSVLDEQKETENDENEVKNDDKEEYVCTFSPADFANPEMNIVIVDLKPVSSDTVETCPDAQVEAYKTIEPVHIDNVETIPEPEIQVDQIIEPVKTNNVETTPEPKIQENQITEPVHISKLETSPEPLFQVNQSKDIKTCEIKPLIVQIVEKSVQRITDNEVGQTKSRKGRVIIMKDVGVQAPDIYIPLDIEKDFGFSDSNLSKVNKGIQVSTADLEVEHVVVESGPVSPKLSPAYF